MKILIIGDPLEELNPKTDTGIFFAEEALFLDHSVFWSTPTQLSLVNSAIYAKCSELKFKRKLETPLSTPLANPLLVSGFDTVWIRKDPPFDRSYVSLCWILKTIEEKTYFANRPSALLNFHEKHTPFIAHAKGVLKDHEIVSTWIPDALVDISEAPAFLKSGPIVTKPWLGHGGHSIKKWNSLKDALNGIAEADLQSTLFQPYLEEITTAGDRRVFILDGEIIGGLLRLPTKGNFVSNLAQGGTGSLSPLSEAQIEVCNRIGTFLKASGIFFAGLDVIGTKISEVNITAPTGFRKITELGGENLARVYLKKVSEEVSRLFP